MGEICPALSVLESIWVLVMDLWTWSVGGKSADYDRPMVYTAVGGVGNNHHIS